jgi:LmbE family N-acetylglucosaminyl deacetylase
MATVLTVAPHQDDETFMGPMMRKHLEYGHDVHVLLLCGGINSAVQASSGLTRPAFGAARDDELWRAIRQIGIRRENVHFARVSMPDGELTLQAAYDAILDFAEDHPGTWLKTYSNQPMEGRHVDHVTSGQAGMELLNDGKVANLRLIVEPWLVDKFKLAYKAIPLMADAPTDQDSVRRALDEYKIVDPVAGKHGFGFKSVGPEMTSFKVNPVNHTHIPVGV